MCRPHSVRACSTYRELLLANARRIGSTTTRGANDVGKTRLSMLLALTLAGALGCEDDETNMPPPDPPTPQGPLPDISFASLWVYPRQPLAGQSFTVGITIRNAGAGPVPAGVTHVARWYPGGTLPIPACEWPLGRLGPGQQVDVSCTYAGTYSNLESYAVLDATDAVDESNEATNTLALPINLASN
jgi:CARDB